MALKFVIFLGLVLAARAQLPGFGSCPEYKAVESFDMTRFLGTWYEYERYFSLFEVGTRCARIEYTTGTDGKYKAANTITSRITGITRVVNGEMKYASSNTKEGRLTIRYEQLPVAINSEYSVVATDYDNYAILWSCSSPVPYLLTTQNAWLMTRDPDPSEAVMGEAIAQFEKLGINRRFISRVDQKSCTAAAAEAAAAAAAAVTTSAPAPAAAPAPAVRNQQVHVKPEVNAIEVEDKKPVVPVVPAEVVKDEEVKVEEVKAEEVKVEEPVKEAEPVVKKEEEAIPEPVVEPAPETMPVEEEPAKKVELAMEAVPAKEAEPVMESMPIKETDEVKSEKVEIAEPVKVTEEEKKE